MSIRVVRTPFELINLSAVSLCASVVLLVQTPGTLARSNNIVERLSDSTQEYWVEQIVEGLNYPSSMAWLPNGDLLITEQMGDLRICRDGKLDPRPVSGTPESYRAQFNGLRDIVVDADYQTNPRIYLLMSEGTFDNFYAAVYRARFDEVGLKDVERIFHAKDNAGRRSMRTSQMVFLADKTLLLAIAEDHHDEAQRLGSYRGKILRINRDGTVPKDNPFANIPGALREIWSYGHRVPLGLYQDLDAGVVWEVEAGPRGGDELNAVKPGSNYGWALASWGFAYDNNGEETPVQSSQGIEDPILVWTPSNTPSGLTRYRGKTYPLWNGDFFVGHLTSRALERLRIDGNRVTLQEKMLLDLKERIRDVAVGPDDHLYVLTDHQNGRVLRLQPGRPRPNQLPNVARALEAPFKWSPPVDLPEGSEDEIANLGPDELMKGRHAFSEKCAVCHSVGEVVAGGDIGPDLGGVYGSLMGRKAGFDYSPDMADSPITWNFDSLNRFLADPNRFVPGTKMASPPVTDAQVRRYIIGFLKQQSTK